MLKIISPYGNYVVNEQDEIHGGPNGVSPSSGWLLIGAVEMRTVFGRFVQTRRFSVQQIRMGLVPWKFKNGKQRCYLLDLDHGSRRMWGSPTPYHTIGSVDDPLARVALEKVSS